MGMSLEGRELGLLQFGPLAQNAGRYGASSWSDAAFPLRRSHSCGIPSSSCSLGLCRLKDKMLEGVLVIIW